MKHTLTLTAALLSSISAFAQLHIPINKGQRIGTTQPYTPTLDIQRKVRNEKYRLAVEFLDQKQSEVKANLDEESGNPDDTAFIGLLKVGTDSSALAKYYQGATWQQKVFINKNIDQQLAAAERAITQQTVDLLNDETSRVHPIVTGGLGNVLSSGASVGNLALGLEVRASRFKLKGNRKIDPTYIYAAWSTSTAKSDDSGNILKTLLFPELAKSDFILGCRSEATTGNFSRGILGEASLATFKDSSGEKLFRSYNFLFGYHISFSGNLTNLNVPAGLRAMLYYNIINVDPKYGNNYREITNEPNIHNSFHCIGLRVQSEVSGASLFFNGKYILNKQGDITNPDLVRFVYTIGTIVSL